MSVSATKKCALYASEIESLSFSMSGWDKGENVKVGLLSNPFVAVGSRKSFLCAESCWWKPRDQSSLCLTLTVGEWGKINFRCKYVAQNGKRMAPHARWDQKAIFFSWYGIITPDLQHKLSNLGPLGEAFFGFPLCQPIPNAKLTMNSQQSTVGSDLTGNWED